MIECGIFWSKSWIAVRSDPSKVKENRFSNDVQSNENPLCDEMRGESLLSDELESILAPVKEATVDAILRTVASNDAKCQMLKRNKVSSVGFVLEMSAWIALPRS